MGKLLDLVLHKRNTGRFYSDIASNAAHGDPHGRLFQGGGKEGPGICFKISCPSFQGVENSIC